MKLYGMKYNIFNIIRTIYSQSRFIRMDENNLKKIRESLMLSKTELARQANVSPITITRIENGMPCRMETQRKIILALGYKFSDKNKIFIQ
jgi:DNA-binding XRE family transcriptional regulator